MPIIAGHTEIYPEDRDEAVAVSCVTRSRALATPPGA
jgi:hypothetical protein